MIIYLVGFMGSGKSTFGRRLAARGEWYFMDLDLVIEKSEDRTIAEIFDQSGEEYFREVETTMLRNIAREENVVLACGGGTPCYNDNMEYMNREGITVYLKYDHAILAHRLVNAKKVRPLVRGMGEEELLEYVRTKLAEREEWYMKAQLIIDGLRADPGKLKDIIVNLHAK
ncbi:MAG: shikimate kinase [Bacteroidales bacterium]|nr:shikimate kinase [Bacteroidales bacterium]